MLPIQFKQKDKSDAPTLVGEGFIVQVGTEGMTELNYATWVIFQNTDQYLFEVCLN